jgi:hypothetical protein
MLNSVDLPAPFGPISPVIDPRRTRSEQSRTARMPPKDFTTDRTTMASSASARSLAPTANGQS